MRKNKKYLDFIRKQKCCLCGNPNVDSHHVRSFIPTRFKGGTGLKPFDLMTVPVCRSCHLELHGGRELENAHYIIIENLCQYINELEHGNS